MSIFIRHLFAVSVTQINNPLPNVSADSSTISTILNILFAVLGGVALLMIIIGGFKFVTSNGDPQSTAKAKDTIIYAAVGLVIVLSAAAIVNFVTGRL